MTQLAFKSPVFVQGVAITGKLPIRRIAVWLLTPLGCEI
jgi:hypothetical protein